MKIDFSTKLALKGLEDSPDLGVVAARALAHVPADASGRQVPLSLDESIKRGRLSLKVAEGGEIDLKSEDITLIKNALPHVWGPVVVALAVDLLDPVAA